MYYPIDPVGGLKRALLDSFRSGVSKTRHFLSEAKQVPGEMIENLLAEQRVSNNFSWRTQQSVRETTRTERWDAQLQLFSLKRMLLRSDISGFGKRLRDFGWQQPEDLPLLVGRSKGKVLTTQQLKQSNWWGWYLANCYNLAHRHQNIAQWNEYFGYLDRHINPPSK